MKKVAILILFMLGCAISEGYAQKVALKSNQVREMPLDTVGHLANGEALKIGTMNIDKLNVKRIKM